MSTTNKDFRVKNGLVVESNSATAPILIATGGNGSNSSIQSTGYNQRGGVGYHGFLQATNSYVSATNPNKFFRINSTGSFEIINSAYTTTLFGLTDAGALAIPSTFTASSIIKSGGTSGQYLMADGSVSTSSYTPPLTLTSLATGWSIAGGTTSKTLTLSNTLTLAGTDSSTLNIGSGGTLGTGAFATIANYAPIASPTFTGSVTAPLLRVGSAPYYQYETQLGGGTDLAFKKLATVTLPTGLYTGMSFYIEVIEVGGNFGNTAASTKSIYFVSAMRSAGVQDDNMSMSLTGPSTNRYLQGVKVDSATYEIQVKSPTSYNHILVRAYGISALNATVAWENATVAGSAGIATYTPTAGNNNWFGNIKFWGTLSKDGGTSAQFLKADGSVDSSTYLTTGTASSTYAPIASPSLTGTPLSTTAASSVSSTQIATTAYVKSLFSSASVSGTLDWNDVSNTRPGVGPTLLLGSATNGPGGVIYYHPFTIQYAGTDGTSNVTQLAIAYSSPANAIWMRGRYNGTWSPWVSFATLAGATFTGQIQSTLANSTTTGGGQLYLNGATGNRVEFNQNGIAAPTLNTRSVGTKIVLYPSVGVSTVDYAMGIDSATFWQSVEGSSAGFKWYAGTTQVASLSGAGLFTAVSKSFDIPHPTKPDMRLRYGSLEGPENGVYVRGNTKENIIELPEVWMGLVDESTITVSLTSVGKFQKVYVEKIEDNKIYIGGRVKEISYVVFGERKDIDKITVEY